MQQVEDSNSQINLDMVLLTDNSIDTTTDLKDIIKSLATSISMLENFLIYISSIVT